MQRAANTKKNAVEGGVNETPQPTAKMPTRLLPIYETDDVQRLLHRTFFGVEYLLNEEDAVPMSFQQFLVTAHLAMRKRAIMGDKLFGAETMNLLDAHDLGLLPPLGDTERSLGGWLSQGVSSMPTTHYDRLPLYVTAVYGDLPLGPLEQEARTEALSTMEKMLSQWEEYGSRPGLFGEGEVEHLEELRDECWEHLREMIDPRAPWRNSLLKRSFLPVVGEERYVRTHFLDGEGEDDDFKKHGLMAILVLRALPSHLERRYHVSNPLFPSLKATVAHLESEHGERNVASRLAAFTDTLAKNPQAMDEVISHGKVLTWEQLLKLQGLTEKYNIEWAVAAMEWERDKETA